MKTQLISKLISLALLFTATAFGQRAVMVNSNSGLVVYPTNLWTVNAPAARTGLGLSSSATNPVTQITNGGTGATNAAGARTNLGIGWSALTNTNAATALLGLDESGKIVANTGTNILTFTNQTVSLPSVSFSELETVFGSTVLFEGPFVTSSEFRGNMRIGEGQQLYFEYQPDANASRANLGFSTNLNTLWTATNASGARSAVGIPWGGLTNTNASGFRSALELSASWLTNTNVTNFRTSVGLGESNNPTFLGLYIGTQSNGGLYVPTNYAAIEVYSPLWIGDRSGSNSVFQFEITGDEAIARTNLGLGAAWLTNTNVTNFRTDIGLGETNDVLLKSVQVHSITLGLPDEDSISVNAYSIGAFNGGIDLENLIFDGNWSFSSAIGFTSNSVAAGTRSNLSLGLPALTNTSNVTTMRALAGSTNTNEPYSGSVAITNTNAVLVFSNGILKSVQ